MNCFTVFFQIKEFKDSHPEGSFGEIKNRPEHIKEIREDLKDRYSKEIEDIFVSQLAEEFRAARRGIVPTRCRLVFQTDHDKREWAGFAISGPYLRWTDDAKQIVTDYIDDQMNDGFGEDLLKVQLPDCAYTVG